ncbi:hypothetical protein [Rudaeicoccus suwonensis]|uniref:DUF4352 domain-containing protein n=1 Tax=Rudaeicoccus suwonensis TaxID=657409 RepID=A0A561E872_9MICO|nr:hypothetical protein [Rudaeicoccus suwonensis]TWE11815.1 hypothetical protein BKA23_0602 [Rudaeicoccus suwonensis]
MSTTPHGVTRRSRSAGQTQDTVPTAGRAGRRTARGLSLVAAVAVVGLCAGCGSSGKVAASASSTASAGTQSSASASAYPSSSGTASAPSSPLAGAAKPVVRDGKTPHPTITAATASFDTSVTYPTGVVLTITSIKQAKETGQGPGVFANAPITEVTVKFTNGSKSTINLEQVVVQMTYGSPARIASPVYNTSAVDFSGSVRPGASQTATYVFSIPSAGLKHNTMTVDFDGTYAAADFTGSVQ